MALLLVLCVCICLDCIGVEVWMFDVSVQAFLVAVEELVRCVVCCIVLFGCSVAASVFVDTVH